VTTSAARSCTLKYSPSKELSYTKTMDRYSGEVASWWSQQGIINLSIRHTRYGRTTATPADRHRTVHTDYISTVMCLTWCRHTLQLLSPKHLSLNVSAVIGDDNNRFLMYWLCAYFVCVLMLLKSVVVLAWIISCLTGEDPIMRELKFALLLRTFDSLYMGKPL
jgi:hypothetical protein